MKFTSQIFSSADASLKAETRLLANALRRFVSDTTHFCVHPSMYLYISISITVKNAIISPNFLMRKFCGKAQFPHSFGRIARNYAETVLFHKISTPGNLVKLRHFMQCLSISISASLYLHIYIYI